MKPINVPFNRPAYVGPERDFVIDAMQSDCMSGDGRYGKDCQRWFERYFGVPRALLTPSCTHALEMAAILIDIKVGDEVIMPSYTFVSTANAFVLRGARIVFVDVRPDTMNIDESLIERAITPKTKAIVVVHYAGVPCEMIKIMDVARRNNLRVVEDAAQAIYSRYKGRLLGTFGDMSTFSFHETKNITSGGEGGLLVINSDVYIERAEIIREKGTNRNKFFRGMVDKYSWVDVGSSYLPSELQAAYLWGQLQSLDKINLQRMSIWKRYACAFGDAGLRIPDLGAIESEGSSHNAHIFFLKCKDIQSRSEFIAGLKGLGISAVFHYVPLHDSIAGKLMGRFSGEDRYTTSESEKLVRLPLWYAMEDEHVEAVVSAVSKFRSCVI
jgi:dTDP-4-amino-4,6-dideoxygalactose transaminase